MIMNKFLARKYIAFTFALMLSGILLWNQSGFSVPAPQSQNIVVHLSHATDDLHRTSMAIDMAISLQRSGANVTLFLDVEGVRILDKNLPQDLTWGFGAKKSSLQQWLQNFVEAGGKFMVCPHCAEAAGLTPSTLNSGAKLAKNSEEVARLFLEADKVIDY
jgi:predicted peroxiredoxin